MPDFIPFTYLIYYQYNDRNDSPVGKMISIQFIDTFLRNLKEEDWLNRDLTD